MAGPTPITPTGGAWVIADDWKPNPVTPITPTGGAWVIADDWKPNPVTPITPTGGAWVIVKPRSAGLHYGSHMGEARGLSLG